MARYRVLKDKDVRKELTDLLVDELEKQKELDGHPMRIIQEFTINSGNARIDVATINGLLSGYEIKSDADTLERLPSQIREYNKIFETITLVVGEKLLYNAIDIIPDWWGIILFKESKSGQLRLYKIRNAQYNHNQSIYHVLNLLHRDEILHFLNEQPRRSAFSYSKMNKRELCNIAAKNIPKANITSSIKNYIIASNRYIRSDQ
ncbi:sce7726 family protein [Candidatus Saccharibacteria bacterium]|nr:sce7726 family protein [Candidatus Saccharibacteria bacterium]